MRRRPSRNMLVVHALSFGLVVVVALFASLRRAEPSDDRSAWAATASNRLSAGDAGAIAAPAAGDGGGAVEVPAPIDLAIAPDGGVPYHPQGTSYRSPFAMPDPGPAVRIKVGVLLNSIDDYDVKTGTFTADLFITSPGSRAA